MTTSDVATTSTSAFTTYNTAGDEIAKLKRQLEEEKNKVILAQADIKVLEVRLEHKNDRLNDAEDLSDTLLKQNTDAQGIIKQVTMIIADMSTTETTSPIGTADKYRRGINKIITVLKQEPTEL